MVDSFFINLKRGRIQGVTYYRSMETRPDVSITSRSSRHIPLDKFYLEASTASVGTDSPDEGLVRNEG